MNCSEISKLIMASPYTPRYRGVSELQATPGASAIYDRLAASPETRAFAGQWLREVDEGRAHTREKEALRGALRRAQASLSRAAEPAAALAALRRSSLCSLAHGFHHCYIWYH